MRGFAIAFGLALLIGFGLSRAEEPRSQPSVRVDENVVLKQAKVVLNMDHLAFAEGKQPYGLNYMKLMLERFAAARTEWEIVGVFHGEAGYMLLNDQAYNEAQNSKNGNPYKEQIAALQKAGIRIEECGQTMRDMGWSNADLLPDVVVNSGANFRIIQLVQDGFVQIQP